MDDVVEAKAPCTAHLLFSMEDVPPSSKMMHPTIRWLMSDTLKCSPLNAM